MHRRTLLKRIGAVGLASPAFAGAASADWTTPDDGGVGHESCVTPSEDPDCQSCTSCPTKCCFCGPC